MRIQRSKKNELIYLLKELEWAQSKINSYYTCVLLGASPEITWADMYGHLSDVEYRFKQYLIDFRDLRNEKEKEEKEKTSFTRECLVMDYLEKSTFFTQDRLDWLNNQLYLLWKEEEIMEKEEKK